MSTIAAERVRVGSVVELADRGCTVISAGGHGIAVFAHDGRFFAVDTRCPHMGFPLSRKRRGTRRCWRRTSRRQCCSLVRSA